MTDLRAAGAKAAEQAPPMTRETAERIAAVLRRKTRSPVGARVRKPKSA